MNRTENKPATDVSATWLERAHVLIHALLFVLGFSLVFVVVFGGTATLLSQLFREYKLWITRLGGVVLIIFGLATMDILRIPIFYMDTRRTYQGKTGTFLGSLAMGIFFAAGWSPCVGPTLGAIIGLGFSQDTVGQAMLLAAWYSLGLGLPFLLLAIGIDRAAMFVRRLGRYLPAIKIVTGVLIILIGLMLLFNKMVLLAGLAERTGLYLDLPGAGSSGAPSFLAAWAAGVLSFLSPCVLPLVPAYLGYLSGRALSSPPSSDRLPYSA